MDRVRYNESCRKLLKIDERTTNMTNLKDIFPHRALKTTYNRYEAFSKSLPPADSERKYSKYLKLYDEIMAAKNDVEKWFKLLLEVEDDEFVIHNVEYRIGTNLLDKTLWKLYIDFLKETNPELMIHTFSKYCRFFLDDKEMLEKYKNETAKYGPIYLSWNSVASFETKYEDKPKEETNDEEFIPEKTSSTTLGTFPKNVFETFMSQNFTLPRPIISYILEKANHIVLRKLFASCKYFFAKKRTPVCYSITISDYITFETENKFYEFNAESLWINEKIKTHNFLLKNLHISNNFNVDFNLDDSFFVSKIIIPKLYRCDSKYFQIYHQNLSINELKFLVGYGNAKTILFTDVMIKDSNNQFILLQDLMALLPNIQKLTIGEIRSNSETGKILATLKNSQKFLFLGFLPIVDEPFDPYEFREYCIKNGETDFSLHMCFSQEEDFNTEFIEKINEVMKDPKYFTEETVKKLRFFTSEPEY